MLDNNYYSLHTTTQPCFDSPEGFVERPEPAGVTAGTEENEPEERETKIAGTSTSGPPSNTGNDIHAECGGVHCSGDMEEGRKQRGEIMNSYNSDPHLEPLKQITHSSTAGRPCGPSVGADREFRPQCSGKSMVLF